MQGHRSLLARRSLGAQIVMSTTFRVLCSPASVGRVKGAVQRHSGTVVSVDYVDAADAASSTLHHVERGLVLESSTPAAYVYDDTLGLVVVTVEVDDTADGGASLVVESLAEGGFEALGVGPT